MPNHRLRPVGWLTKVEHTGLWALAQLSFTVDFEETGQILLEWSVDLFNDSYNIR